ncbi:MAG: SIS domain-containing protein [Dictyoglomaceae bacterium]
MNLVEKEIREQVYDLPKVYEYVVSYLERYFPKTLKDKDLIYFIGCGTSFYLALSASKYFTLKTGIEAKALPGGEVTFKSIENLGRNPLKRGAVLISRSGESTEIVEAGKVFRELEIETFGITLGKESSLTKVSNEVLVLPIKEESIVMTKSFSSILLSLQMLASNLSGEKDLKVYAYLIQETERIIEDAENLIEREKLSEGKHYVFLGVGIQEGIARESALKLEEMSLSKTEAYSTYEYRHGPKSLVEEGVVITIYGEREKEEEKLREELKSYGGKVILIGKEGSDLFVSNHFPYDLSLRVIFAQILGLRIAERKGLDVEKPRNLTRVVRI